MENFPLSASLNHSQLLGKLPDCHTGCHRHVKRMLGAEDVVEWQYFESTKDAVDALRAEGYKIYSIELCEGSIALQNFETVPGERYAVVLGNEVKGVQQAVVDASDGAIEIPQFGTKHSLNVSVTAGMVIWEFANKLGLV